MELRKIIKEIKKHTWWSEETPGVHQIAQWAWRGFSESSKYFDPRFYPSVFLSIGMISGMKKPREMKNTAVLFLLNKFSKNKNYLKQKRKEWLRIVKPSIKDGRELTREMGACPVKSWRINTKVIP